MTYHRPIAFAWDGEVMKPLRPRDADREYVVGERYMLVPHYQRSQASHNHEFGWLADAWMNLPEAMGDQFATPEHLRKYALIKAGYRDEHSIVCASRAEALRIAAFIRPIDEFAVVTITGSTVTRYTAKSQSRKAMGAKDFQASKEAIMDVVANMLGVEPRELKKIDKSHSAEHGSPRSAQSMPAAAVPAANDAAAGNSLREIA